jgi:drug/metabolite transporter (DMT)-like permease
VSAVLLALAASGAWGISDFLGGVRARTVSLPVVLLLSQLAGLMVLLGAWAARGPQSPGLTANALVSAALAGACGVTALGALYLVTARAGLALVAPISAVAAALPVLAELARGESLSARTGIGVVLALLGALAVGLPDGTRRGTRLDAWSVTTASVAAVGGAGFFLLIRDASRGADPVLATVAGRLCGVALVAAWAMGQWPQLRAAARPGLPALAAVAAVGVTDAAGELFYATASTRAPLTIVTPLASLYPAVAVGLALVVVRERLGRRGPVGIACAMAGVVLLG